MLSRRNFCLCCLGAAGAGLTPHRAFAEARGLVTLIKDSAATSPILTHRLRNDVVALEGSGGTVAVSTGPDGKVLIDAGIGVSREQMTRALAALGADPVTHLINTHWHFDHTDGNTWLNEAGAKIIAQENTRRYLSQVERVADWDYNFLALPDRGLPTEVFGAERTLRLNGHTVVLKHYAPAHTDSDISVTFSRSERGPRSRHLLERHLSVHRLFDRRQHRRDDRGIRRQSRHDERTTPSSSLATAKPLALGVSFRISGICLPPFARKWPRLRGKDARRTRRSRPSRVPLPMPSSAPS